MARLVLLVLLLTALCCDMTLADNCRWVQRNCNGLFSGDNVKYDKLSCDLKEKLCRLKRTAAEEIPNLHLTQKQWQFLVQPAMPRSFTTMKRAEVMHMTNLQRQWWWRAMNATINTYPDPDDRTWSEFSLLALMARLTKTFRHGSGHFPARRFLLHQFEMVLKTHEEPGREVIMATWEPGKEKHLERPHESFVFQLFTSRHAPRIPRVDRHCRRIGNRMVRSVDRHGAKTLLMSSEDISAWISKSSYSDLTRSTRRDLYTAKPELDHDATMLALGGHAADPSCAPYDPLFWMLSAHLDCLWEGYRSIRPSDINDYPNAHDLGLYGGDAHAATATMHPFRAYNAHAMHPQPNAYPHFQCLAPNASLKCRTNRDCFLKSTTILDQQWMWCHKSWCVSKLAKGSPCKSDGQCQSKYCHLFRKICAPRF